MVASLYGPVYQSLLAGSIVYATDTIKAMLCPVGYTPDPLTHQFKSSVTEISAVSTTLSSAASAAATTISTAASIPVGTQIQIDTAGLAEVRTVSAVSGAGPYTLTVAALSNAHASGAAVVASPGYTAGGATLASKTATLTVANSWGTSRANSTAYALGDVVRPATGNGYLYQAVAAGTSAGTIPTYPTVVGQSVTDGSVTWVCKGRAVLALDAADPAWSSSTITARTVVIYKSTGTDATSPLIAYDSAGADVSSTAGTWTYQVNAAGFALFFLD